MISHKPKFIFVHINCCAGTSIESALSEWGNWQPKNPKLFVASQHSKIGEYQSAYFEFEEYFTFTIVRNPWDRMVTYYRTHGRFHSQSFSEWVTALGTEDGIKTLYDHPRMYSSCASWICEGDDIAVDYVGRFENLAESFEHIASRIGIEASLPHLNKSSKGEFYTDYYDETSRRIVAERFQRDLELFGYRFGE